LLLFRRIIRQRWQDHVEHRWTALTPADHYRFEEAEDPPTDCLRGEAAHLFSLEKLGNVYTRIMIGWRDFGCQK
jgi:hypothetical protein